MTRQRTLAGTAARAAAAIAAGIALLLGLTVVGATIVTSSAASTLCAADQTGGDGIGGWFTVGATLDPSTAPQQAYPAYFDGGLSYAELGATPGFPNYVGGLLARALGLQGGVYGLPAGFALDIRAVGSQGTGVEILKSDIGSGQAGDLRYAIDLHPAIAAAIGFDGKQDVQIRVANPSLGSLPTSTDDVSCITAIAGPAGAQKLLQMAIAVEGAPYTMANHSSAFTESAAELLANGTDCSGFASWLMGPQGLNIWAQPYVTGEIPQAPGLATGPGQYITLWDNPLNGSDGHVWLTILGRSFEEDAGTNNVHEMNASEVAGYLAGGDNGNPYIPFHPANY